MKRIVFFALTVVCCCFVCGAAAITVMQIIHGCQKQDFGVEEAPSSVA